MKIKLNKIKFTWYDPREEIDEGYIDELAESIKTDGLWTPILVKRNADGIYDLISGRHRIKAVQKLGWDEIEANILDVDDTIASILAIKTNILQKNLTDIEEAKAIKRIIDKYDFTQSEIAKKLGKSQAWVSNRISLVLDVSQKVQNALKEEKISTSHAVLLSKLSKEEQDEFVEYVISKKLNINESKEALNKYQNKTIFTIGYQGKEIDEFIKILENNNVELLIDIRESGKSSNKVAFNSEILEREFKKTNIKYLHKPELGVIFEIREPYIEGYIDDKAFKGWYEWHLNNIEFDISNFIELLKKNGKCCLMCMEKYAKPNKTQKYHCHRDFLVEIILKAKLKDPLLIFDKRKDL